jgi:DNA-binding NarL/FixJ family response regulator
MGRGSQEGRVMRIVLADDQELIRFSIRSVLAGEEDIEVVGEASTGRESLDLCRRLKPDLVLMDIEMPEMDGIEATRRIKEDLPETSVLMLTSQDDPDYLLDAIQAGAAGYVLKENALFQITSAIRSVLDGEPSLDPGLSMGLLRRLSGQPSEDSHRAAAHRKEVIELLTNRELEVLGLIALGRTNHQIAQELFLSVGTVKTHTHHIVRKLEVSDRTQAAVLAIKLGLEPSGGKN